MCSQIYSVSRHTFPPCSHSVPEAARFRPMIESTIEESALGKFTLSLSAFAACYSQLIRYILLVHACPRSDRHNTENTPTFEVYRNIQHSITRRRCVPCSNHHRDCVEGKNKKLKLKTIQYTQSGSQLEGTRHTTMSFDPVPVVGYRYTCSITVARHPKSLRQHVHTPQNNAIRGLVGLCGGRKEKLSRSLLLHFAR